jgi:hypothetical protein
MGVVANCRLCQPLHEGLAVVSYALLDCDKKVALLLKTILEMIMVDDLDGPSPARRASAQFDV